MAVVSSTGWSPPAQAGAHAGHAVRPAAGPRHHRESRCMSAISSRRARCWRTSTRLSPRPTLPSCSNGRRPTPRWWRAWSGARGTALCRGANAPEMLQMSIWRQRQSEYQQLLADYDAKIHSTESTITKASRTLLPILNAWATRQGRGNGKNPGKDGNGSKLKALTASDTRPKRNGTFPRAATRSTAAATTWNR